MSCKHVIMTTSCGKRVLLEVMNRERLYDEFITWGRQMTGTIVSNDNPFREYIPDLKVVQ